MINKGEFVKINLASTLEVITKICIVLEEELKILSRRVNKNHVGTDYLWQYDEEAKRDKYFRWVPKSPYALEGYFINILNYLETNKKLNVIHTSKQRKLKFLDIGCGLGQVIMAANFVGLDGYGLELREEYVKTACQYIPIENLILMNALEYKEYDKYEILYAYCPIQDDKLMQQLLNTITNQVKSGTLFVYAAANTARLDSEKWKMVGDSNHTDLFVRK